MTLDRESAEKYRRGPISRVRNREEGWKLTMGETLQKAQEVNADDLMAAAKVYLDPEGKKKPTAKFKASQKRMAKSWIEELGELDATTADRLKEELDSKLF